MGTSRGESASVIQLFKTRGPKKRLFGRRLVIRDYEQALTFAQVLSSPTRLKILFYLSTHGEAAMTELAKALNTTTANISMQAKELEKHGLIEIVASRSKGFRKILRLRVDRIMFSFPSSKY